jgi:radical SAM protein with 4Fe4S-binding SPASM domain
VLNSAALDIAEQLEAGCSSAAIADQFVVRYGIPYLDALQDVETAENQLLQNRLIGSSVASSVRMPRLESLFLHLTTRCNLACAHCYYAHPSVRDLSSDVVLRLIDDLAAQGGRKITLSGGEPLLYPGIREVLSHIGGRLEVDFLTNGTLLTKEWATFLAGEVDPTVQISLDGSCETVHETIRGKGSFAGALRAVQFLQDAGMGHKLVLAVTITQRNGHDLDNIIDLAKALGIPNVRFLPVRTAGRALQNWNSVGENLDLKTYEAFFDRVLALRAEDLPNMRVSCGLSGFILHESEGEDCDGIWCPVGRNLAVATNGDAFPCVSLMRDPYKLGNVFQDSLSDLTASTAMKEICRVLAERRSRIEKCSSCLWRNFCQGGCMGHALDFRGTVWAPDQFCAYRDRRFRRVFDGFLEDFCAKSRRPSLPEEDCGERIPRHDPQGCAA